MIDSYDDAEDLAFFNLDAENLYLLFRLGKELFATPLLGVREVCENKEFKPVPNMDRSFIGVFNLRGEIISAVDLCLRFKIDSIKSGDLSDKAILLVFDTEKGPLAALVDEIIDVLPFDASSIQNKLNFDTVLPPEYMLGLSKYQEKIVSVVDLPKVVSRAELVDLLAQQNHMQRHKNVS